MTEQAVSPLRRRMIEDMSIRKFAQKNQPDYVQRVKDFKSIGLLNHRQNHAAAGPLTFSIAAHRLDHVAAPAQLLDGRGRHSALSTANSTAP